MKYVVIINDCGGKLTYYTAKQFTVDMLDSEFIKNYREIESEVINSMYSRDFSRNFKNDAEVYKVYVHINNLKYENVVPIGFSNVFNFTMENTKEIIKPVPKYLLINYDFISGKELPYTRAIECKEDFETNCLTFFNFDNLAEYSDIIVRKQNGDYISAVELLRNEYSYCTKQIRLEHNICRMLIANSFEFRKGVL